MKPVVSEELLHEVLGANREIPRAGLATLTWGNVSGIDRAAGIYVIKPSGVRYEDLRIESLVAVDLDTGAVVAGDLRPSVDSETHRMLYQNFASIGGVTHTHSSNACAFSQANRDIPVLGTTHADTFGGPIRCSRALTAPECAENYEANTGRVIIELFNGNDAAATAVPAALVANHGPFTWGASPRASLECAIVCEAVAEMALRTLALNPAASAPQHLLDRHFSRKHGAGAYYGNDPVTPH